MRTIPLNADGHRWCARVLIAGQQRSSECILRTATTLVVPHPLVLVGAS